MIKFELIEYNYNATPVHVNKRLLFSSDYQDWVLTQVGISILQNKKVVSCVRIIFYFQYPLSPELSQLIANFIYPL